MEHFLHFLLHRRCLHHLRQIWCMRNNGISRIEFDITFPKDSNSPKWPHNQPKVPWGTFSCRSAYGKLWENSNHVKATGARLTSDIFSSEFRMNHFHTLLSSPHWIIHWEYLIVGLRRGSYQIPVEPFPHQSSFPISCRSNLLHFEKHQVIVLGIIIIDSPANPLTTFI